MSQRFNLRALRALTTCALTTALVFSPAVAEAATKKKAASKKTATALKEANNKKPAKTISVAAPANDTGLGNRLGLGPTMQLAAMTTAIKATPNFYAGRSTGCSNLTAMLASQPGQIMAGNFRDAAGNCYVWLNLQQSSMLTGSEICKTTLHELGHLTGLQHSQDPNDVMFAPFQSDPIPAPCQAQPAAPTTQSAATNAPTKANRKVKAKSSATICPPGATNADYCQTVITTKKKATTKKRSTRTAAAGRK